TPLARLSPGDRVWMAGVVAQARMQMTRRGRMMVLTLDDASAQVEITVFNELFEKSRDKIREDALLVVAGKVQRDEFSGGLRAGECAADLRRHRRGGLVRGPAHVAGVAAEQPALMHVPAVHQALVRIEVALLREEALELRIALLGLLAGRVRRAGDLEAAAGC